MVPSASSKYYVYGGGRWRELDTATGRVSGWRGAKLCVARRGRLAVQRGAARRRLLAALRALAAGQESRARDGPRLQPSLEPTPAHKARCRCCCHHNNNNKDDDIRCGSKASAQRSLTSDACIQAAPPEPARRPLHAFPPPAVSPPSRGVHLVTTVATIHTNPRDTSTPISPRKRRNSSTSWKHDLESTTDSTEHIKYTNNSPKKMTNASPRKTNASPIKKASLSLKRKRCESEITTDTSKDEISISQSILKRDFNARYLRPRRAGGQVAPRIRTRVIHREVVEVSSDDENKDPTVRSHRTHQRVNEILDTETEDDIITKHKSVDVFKQKSQKLQDIYRELVISEDDVDVLRRFMIKNNRQFDLYKYDNDDAYKAKFFYSINPLVSIEPCPRIVAMLEGRDTLSLQQFASQLGLRSVSDGASSSGRASPRKRRRPPPIRASPDSEDKENLEAPVVRRSNRHNITKGKDDTEGGKKPTDMTEVSVTIERLKDEGSRPRRSLRAVQREDNHTDTLMSKVKGSREDTHLNGERPKQQRKGQKHQKTDDEGRKQVDEEHSTDKQKVTVKRTIKARPDGSVGTGTGDFRSKEYSSLEDHAIVEWISSGDRAKLVNGNRVWRMLEQSFEEIGGRARSWHSLRNRYLRYLLPALGHLELPATQQARLRALAAQGEIKGKKHPQRRNSIYEEPPRGASSRDPRRSPRYSDVTRQFAARHVVPSTSSASASASSASEFEVPARAPGPRTRTPNTRSPGSRTRTPNTRSPGPRTRTPSTRSSGPGPRSRTRKLYNPNKL